MAREWVAFCIDGWTLLEDKEEKGAIIKAGIHWYACIRKTDNEPVFIDIKSAAKWVINQYE